MKTLSIIIPCYNSKEYLDKCVNSILKSGEDLEIILVNDGSTDETPLMINEYVSKFPNTIIGVHQENKGHGGAVNAGISNASGEYIKVVDSDDWVNSEALSKVIKQLNFFIEKDQSVDMMISNFIYDKVGVEEKTIMNYREIIPVNQVIGWKDIKTFSLGKYILMHSVIYNRRVLERSELILPEHTFYVDNLFVFLPLEKVESIFYMDEDLYHYYIGRADQSVNEDNMIKRINQQIKVNLLMLERVNLHNINEKSKKKYMISYFNIITAVTSVMLLKKGTREALKEKRLLWRTIRKHDLSLYLHIRFSLLGSILNLPGVMGRKISLLIYSKARRIVGFN